MEKLVARISEQGSRVDSRSDTVAGSCERRKLLHVHIRCNVWHIQRRSRRIVIAVRTGGDGFICRINDHRGFRICAAGFLHQPFQICAGQCGACAAALHGGIAAGIAIARVPDDDDRYAGV